MYGIDILIGEHEEIVRFVESLRRANLKILEEGKLDLGYFRQAIDFIRNYADKIHHGKEEDILFARIQEHLGDIGRNLIDHGMLVEHDLARYNLLALEEALDRYEDESTPGNVLDIMGHSLAYRDLLIRHADKENRAVYAYAKKSLPGQVLDEIDQETEEFQKKYEESGELAKYKAMLEDFEKRF